MNLSIKPLAANLAADYFDFFDNRAFSDNAEWSCCYCTWFHMDKESEREVGDEVKADGGSGALRRALRNRAERFISEGTLRGYLAYVDGVPIGFCNANDKSAYIRHIGDMATEGTGRVKAVACFVIAPAYRGKGVATALLERVVADAGMEGYSAVEGYPKLNEKSNALNFTGPSRLYERAGFLETARFNDRAIMRKLLERNIESHILEALTGDAQRNALDFAAFLRANEIVYDGAYEMRYKGKLVCYIDTPNAKNRWWSVWTVGDYGNEYERFHVDERTKEISWANVVKCGNRADCDRDAKTVVVFGKEFTNVCNGTDGLAMRFINPSAEELECAKKLVEIRKNYIDGKMG